ncbi:MAG TPA: class I SAM-dependent methyltransferase, partial [Chloroflexota bacterium]|nr:class I SAM-dependent methyltransferase [Chloroflexota bacterium]
AGARRALDLGCGPGRHTVALAHAGYQVAATDVSPTGLAHCRDWLASLGLRATLAEADMRALPFGDGEFDLVVSYNVIYHATKAGMRATLSEIARVLRPAGHLFITLIATDDAKYHQYRAKVASGEGVEVEPNTYRIPDDPDEDGDLPHHFVDEAEARELLNGYEIFSLEAERFDRREPAGQTVTKVHWHVFCRKPATPAGSHDPTGQTVFNPQRG